MFVRPLSAFLRRRLPRVYRPLRRAYAFVEYARVRLAAPEAEGADAYDDAFWNLHADGTWDWPGFAACIVRHTGARRVVDVGCGDAKLLAVLRARTPGLVLRGYDGSPAARARAQRRGIDVHPLDLAGHSSDVRRQVRAEIADYDTALCFEVAEHLLPWHAGRLLDLLTACPTVVFSAAHPGQGGTLHVNERPARYWIERFSRLGFERASGDDAFRQELAALRLPPWYAQNAHLFRRRGAAG